MQQPSQNEHKDVFSEDGLFYSVFIDMPLVLKKETVARVPQIDLTNPMLLNEKYF
jgi:hypothetical protein